MTFGKYHHWHRDDPLKARTLVYASFPSPQLVPRDVVFGEYAVVGGARQSWTAACYVLTADFADQMPTDEDPMPLDGNPHPLPGELQPDPNNFVMPQFPEIGWNVIPNNNVNEQQEDANPPEQAEEQVMQESVVLDHSLDTENSSVNMMQEDAIVPDQIVTTPAQNTELQINIERAIVPFIPLARPWLPSAPVLQTSQQLPLFVPVYGPILPPEMIWK